MKIRLAAGVGQGLWAGLVLAVWGACAAPGPDDQPGLGTVRFSLSQAPATARCAAVSAVPAMGATVTRRFELGPGQPALFSAEGLPTGMVDLTEQVFTVSCALLGAEMPAWISDPVSVTLRAGVALDVTFSLHLASAGGQVSVVSDFPRTQPMMTEFPLAEMSDPLGIVAGADGNVWFTQPQANKIARITPAGVVTEFSLANDGAQPTAIVNGPDESLWFTEAGAATIGRITTTGAIREFSIPSGTPAVGIIAGPDGNIWFLEPGRAGRVTPTGTITEIGLPGHPKSIAAGPDGNVWFAAEFFGRINTTTLGISGLAGVGLGKIVTSMAAGPDGAMWFTVTNNTSGPIGRISTTGTRSFFTLPESMQSAESITAGPDGNLWFSDPVVGAVGRLTVVGVVTEFLTPSASTPKGISAGPDRSLWYTDTRGKIGRVRP